MKAAYFTEYGEPEVLKVIDIPKPVPKDNEVLIRIFATAVNSGDFRIRKADPWVVRLFFGLVKPKKNILGGVLSGVIESAGKNVTRYKKGDLVFGSAGINLGTHTEYICLPQNGTLALKPENISHTEAAGISFGGTAALYFLKKAGISKGKKILIYGASGAVGSAAVQLARYFGADVTGVCSLNNAETVRSLGASEVIDYTKEDFNNRGQKYDIIFETVDKLSYSECFRSLKKGGVLILGSAGFFNMFRGLWTSMISNKKVISGIIKENSESMDFLKELIEKGYYKPVIDRVFPLEQIAEAHRYAEKGHKKGNVAIKVAVNAA